MNTVDYCAVALPDETVISICMTETKLIIAAVVLGIALVTALSVWIRSMETEDVDALYSDKPGEYRLFMIWF